MQLRRTITVTLLFTTGLISHGDRSYGQEPVDYERHVKPVLKSRCYACHGAIKQEASLRLDTGALIRSGGDSGPAITPGDGAQSLLLERVSDPDESTRMPPEGEPLTTEQITLLRRWIEQGAPSPENESPQVDPSRHWAFVPPVRSTAPTARNTAWVHNPIDAFTAAVHQQHGLHRAPPAQKQVLLRRVYLDLTGLPPTREQLHAFLNDDKLLAYERVVERLLNQPQYGERWGRHWMDVWRYSDWYGRRAVDDVRNSHPDIWRWRDWIVNSLNQDRPYDQMICEMLAADEISPLDDQAIAATGFIVRNWFSLNYDQWKRDLVEHTSKAFLGLRLNCALCHDHKYDPITQEEYFRFRAFFEPLEFRQDRVPGGPRVQKYKRYVPGSGALLKPSAGGLARVYDFEMNPQTFMYQGGDARDRFPGRPPVTPGFPAILGPSEAEAIPVSLPPQAWYPGLKEFAQTTERQQADAVVKAAEKKLQAVDSAQPELQLAKARLHAAKSQAAAVKARIAADNTQYQFTNRGEASDATTHRQRARRLEREAAVARCEAELATAEAELQDARSKPEQDAGRKKQTAAAQSKIEAANKKLAAANKKLAEPSGTYTALGPQYPQATTGRRRALAQWIVDRKNPLTARVAINHIWMRHFGRPLVESVVDFGLGGKPPSHPQLLDWLAVELMDHDWSMKHIHRLIVTSNTYRMSSQMGSGLERVNTAIDRDNRNLWRFPRRRVEAEVVRDSVLHATGVLDNSFGGPTIENDNTASRRRSLYFSVHPEDGGSFPLTISFDPPDPCDCYRRQESVAPQQALALVNSDFIRTNSRLLARRLWTNVLKDSSSKDTTTTFIVTAFEHLLSRRPASVELRQCTEFLQRQTKLYAAVNPSQLKSEKTAATPPSLDSAMRSRESLVRVLFSHHDFVTMP